MFDDLHSWFFPRDCLQLLLPNLLYAMVSSGPFQAIRFPYPEPFKLRLGFLGTPDVNTELVRRGELTRPMEQL